MKQNFEFEKRTDVRKEIKMRDMVIQRKKQKKIEGGQREHLYTGLKADFRTMSCLPSRCHLSSSKRKFSSFCS